MELSPTEMQLIAVALANKITRLYDLKDEAQHAATTAEVEERLDRAKLFEEDARRLDRQIRKYKALDKRITSGI